MISNSNIGRRYGCIPDLPDHRDKLLQNEFSVLRSSYLPASSFLREYAPSVIDQMSVGCCTGAGTSRALKLKLNQQNYKWKYTPSAFYIYARVRQMEGTPLFIDSGAMIRDVMKVINKKGVCPEDSNPEWSWPFSASDDRWKMDPPADCDEAARLHTCLKYYRVPQNPQAIKTAIVNKCPLVIGITVYESFESKKVTLSGKVPLPGWLDSPRGGHCMYIHSYIDDRAIGANSWGSDWGADGHFDISIKDYLCNPNYCSDIWALELAS